jgi:hypothetical protein
MEYDILTPVGKIICGSISTPIPSLVTGKKSYYIGLAVKKGNREEEILHSKLYDIGKNLSPRDYNNIGFVWKRRDGDFLRSPCVGYWVYYFNNVSRPSVFVEGKKGEVTDTGIITVGQSIRIYATVVGYNGVYRQGLILRHHIVELS